MKKSNSKSLGTARGLFIIESLELIDEDSRREGVVIEQILRLGGMIPVKYIYIRTEQELAMALREFQRSNYRYLHLSCHGDHSSVSLTLDQLTYEDFAAEISPYLKGRRLFFSACKVVNEKMARLIMSTSECQSIIGPSKKINFDDSLLMWASFYHLAFRDEETTKLFGGKIRWALRKVHYAFQQEFRYYRKDGNRWTQEDVEKR